MLARLITFARWSRAIAAMRQEPPHHVTIDRVEPDVVLIQPDKQMLYGAGELLQVAFSNAPIAQVVQELRDQRP